MAPRFFVCIDANHPLSRFYVHGPPYLELNQLKFTSVEACYFYCILRNAGCNGLAENLRHDSRLKEHPGEIRSWCSDRGFEPPAASIFACRDIFHNIILHQLKSEDNPFTEAMIDTMAKFDKQVWPLLQFRCCTSNTSDYVFSTGLRASAFNGNDSCRESGYNIYGLILRDVAQSILNVQIDHYWSEKRLFKQKPWIRGYSKPKTVCIISDSMCKQVANLYSGTVVSVSGGTFYRLITECINRDIQFCQYEFLVCHVGINDVQRSEQFSKDSWYAMFDFLQAIIHNGFPAKRILISLPIPHPNVAYIDTYSSWIQETLSNSSMKCFNWADNPEPFVNEYGEQVWDFYDHDDFHLCHAGFRRLWEQWCVIFPKLKYVGYKLRPIRRARRRLPQ